MFITCVKVGSLGHGVGQYGGGEVHLRRTCCWFVKCRVGLGGPVGNSELEAQHLHY